MRSKGWKLALLAGIGVLPVAVAVFATWMFSLPPATVGAAPPPVSAEEIDATLSALRPPKRQRPVIAIIGINDATETTDYLMPYGILRRADVADVVALATGPGPVKLYPALVVQPDATIAEFDKQYPEGADYVIVPAMSRDDDPAALGWIRDQAAKGAVIVGVCAGAKVVGAAGLLDGRKATTHWYFLDELRRENPTMRYVANRRFVVDGSIATTTGVSASMPMSLTLIEAIAGREKAEEVARGIGLSGWDARHSSETFRFNRPFAMTILRNTLAFWNSEQLGIELTRGIDEVSLALVADSWSRTYRSRALTFAGTGDAIETRNGMRVIPDRIAATWPAERLLPPIGSEPPVHALSRTLPAIADRYGTRTAEVVAMQMEYPRFIAPWRLPQDAFF